MCYQLRSPRRDRRCRRDEWERTFNICWGGVYNCTRAFLPMLQNAEEGHIVNTSSINGFWASVGSRSCERRPHV